MINEFLYRFFTIIVKLFGGVQHYHSEKKANYNWFMVKLESRHEDDGYLDLESGSYITIAFGNKYTGFKLPKQYCDVVYDYGKEQDSKYDWYKNKEYGFSYFHGSFDIKFGEVDDFLYDVTEYSKKSRRFHFMIPWKTQYREVLDLLNIDGSVFRKLSSKENGYDFKLSQPNQKFICRDFDGEYFETTCTLTYEEYWKGSNKFWRYLFRPFLQPLIKTYLNMEFSEGIGNQKESWKGGIISCSTEYRETDSNIEYALRRYGNNPDIRGFRSDVDENFTIIGDKKVMETEYQPLTIEQARFFESIGSKLIFRDWVYDLDNYYEIDNSVQLNTLFKQDFEIMVKPWKQKIK